MGIGQLKSHAVFFGIILATAASGDPAAAQHYEGCFIGGKQVADSMCSGAAGGASPGGGAAAGAAGSLGFAIGAGIGNAIRNLILEDSANGSASQNLNNRGVALANEGRKAEAAALFSQAVSIDPSNDVALGNYLVTQAQLEFLAGNYAKARELAIEAIRYSGGPVDIAKHDLAVYEQAIEGQKQAAAARFSADQQNLLSQIRPLSATSAADSVANAQGAGASDPKPVYRDSDTPRTYPNFADYSDAEHKVHDTNEIGTLQAQAGDWKGALSTFQDALRQDDPNSPFHNVIQENIAIARRHIAADKTPVNGGAMTKIGASASAKPKDQRTGEIQNVADPHCDLFSKQGDGTLHRVCSDDLGHRYCEQAIENQPGAAVTRIVCP